MSDFDRCQIRNILRAIQALVDAGNTLSEKDRATIAEITAAVK